MCGGVNRQGFGYKGFTVKLHANRTCISALSLHLSPCAFPTLKTFALPSDGDVLSRAVPPSMSQKYFLTQDVNSARAGVPLSLLSQP